MTREEIKDELYRMLSDVVNGGYPKRNNTQRGRYREAVKKAIEALEQEPCEDCVSRDFIKSLGATCIARRNTNGELIAILSIDNLPPVTSKQTFEGMTNGEVIQTIFPECDVCDPIIEDNIIHVCFKDNPTALDAFTYTWWNAPYNGGDVQNERKMSNM